MAGPDAARFLDCATRALTTPVFAPIASPVAIGVALLSWTASEPGAIYVLEEAGRADLGGAVEIWRGDDLSQLVELAHEGPYYYRIHAERGENVSDSSVVGLFAADSDFAATQPDDYDAVPLARGPGGVAAPGAGAGRPVRAARPAGALWRSVAAAAHRDALLAALGPAGHALSYAALYHPWLVTARGETQSDLLAVPPEGAVAATMARRARERGAWIAPARQPLSGIVALAPTIPDSAREGIAASRVNLLRHDPHGFMASDALTLSDEVDWDQINIRRLMSFLRRMAVREGQVFVFEPNGDVLRRSIERRFGQMLDALVARGAFAGKGAADSYRLLVTTTDQDRMNGPPRH